MVRQGPVRQGWAVKVGMGMVWLGTARRSGRGDARLGAAWKGYAVTIGTENRKTGFRVHDPRMVRLWNPETRRYLHLSADMETDGLAYAWLGYRHQANALRDRAAVRGEAWPYQVEA